jgi:hypothetical protein
MTSFYVEIKEGENIIKKQVTNHQIFKLNNYFFVARMGVETLLQE